MADSAEPVEVKPCPGCNGRLSVLPENLGSDVECPSCQTVFRAEKNAPRRAAVVSSRRVEEDPPARQKARRSRRDDYEEDDDDRPRVKKSRRHKDVESKRILAGVLALTCGGLGIHKFVLGYTNAGVLQILLSCVGAGGIIAMVEGIIYLTKTDEEFVETYQIGTKEWF